jgi:threonylcarbamoyladenosine tRNA methylthiotransferase MtaB
VRVFLDSLGCRLNEAELESWSSAFARRGHRVLAHPEDAEVVVLNTCAVTTQAARRSRKKTSALHAANPSAKLVLTGCYAELAPDTVASLAGVDRVIGNRDKDALVEVVSAMFPDERPQRAQEPEATLFARGRTRAFVKVADGCRNRCSFCVVTVARGAERSVEIQAIVDQVKQRYEEGVREVVLTAVHLGGYGHDIGSTLTELIQTVLDETAMPWIRFGSLEPWDLPDDFFALWEDPRLCPHLHLPLQSGCDGVLRRMARRTTTALYRGLAGRAREAGIDLTTDLIVGFPGETDDEFAASLSFAEDMGFSDMHLFRYSAREGTAAARMPRQVSGVVKRERMQRAQALSARLRGDRLAREVGRWARVHWERDGRGYTDSYLRVVAGGPVPQRNSFERLQVVGADSGALVVARR